MKRKKIILEDSLTRALHLEDFTTTDHLMKFGIFQFRKYMREKYDAKIECDFTTYEEIIYFKHIAITCEPSFSSGTYNSSEWFVAIFFIYVSTLYGEGSSLHSHEICELFYITSKERKVIVGNIILELICKYGGKIIRERMK